MGTAGVAVLGVFVVFQVLISVTAEDPTCVPGFDSDMVVFRVHRKHLRPGTILGKVGFEDCSGRTIFVFKCDDSRFTVNGYGVLKVKRHVTLHQGHLNFLVHSLDKRGKSITIPVRVSHHVNHHSNQHHSNQHHSNQHHSNQHHSNHPVNHHSDHHANHHSDQHHNDQHHNDHHGNRHGDHHVGHNQSRQHHQGEHSHQHGHSEAAPASNTENGTSSSDVPVIHFPKSTKGLKRRKRDWVIPPINIAENERGPFPKVAVQIRSDQDKVKKILYSITGPGADLEPKNLFTMDRDSGTLSVTQPLDREKQAQYKLIAHAVADGSGTAEDPMDILVNVIDQNDNNPYFTQATFTAAVPEASPSAYEVVTLEAKDDDEPNTDNSDIRYSIISQEPTLPQDNLFVINPVSGVIRVNAGGLDREKYPKYTLEVQVADTMGRGLTGRAKVILTVTDSNDNPPAFTEESYEASVSENKAGAEVVKMSIIDGDEPHSPAWNAKFRIVDGDPGGFFKVETGLNKDEGIISTVKGLDFEKAAKYTLLVAVENEVPFATDLPTATTTVVVNVQDVNEAPVFNPPVKLIVKREDMAVDSELVQYTATDPDTARKQKVMYKALNDPAGWLNVHKETGLITVKSPMDRESLFVKDGKYTALIGAYDNDEVPATGTGTLEIQLEDVNDNAPAIDEREIRVCNKDSAPQLLSVTDKDGPGFTSPYTVSLQGTSRTNWTARMNDTKTGIILTLATELPDGVYNVVMRVADNFGLDQESTILATVCDCTGPDVACKGLREAGIGLPVILGILGAILLLLMLVLLLLMFLRRRGGEKREPLLQDDDVRDNIYYYDEEGGGEDDQDYDLSVLHRGLDNRPDVFRNDVVPNFMPAPQYRPRPANPEEIGNFIDDNLKAADNDPTAPPYDSLLVFDYEGGGSDAGSLSSLNSSSDGDQDYDCLSEWGPRFKKLADMYGGGDDDML